MNTVVSEPSSKDNSLETIRGLAACVVVAWHSTLGFYPERSGLYSGIWPGTDTVMNHIWFGLFNGPAAVVVFFTLSGYVLTRRFFLDGNTTAILRGGLKRWPRLLGPVIIVVLFSWLLFKLRAYHFADAASITKSDWLRTFAYSMQKKVLIPNFWEAISEGSIGTFFWGRAYYDSSLWTMKYELIGSYFAFGLALAGRPLIRQHAMAFIFLVIIVGALCHAVSPFYLSFIVGVSLAALLPREYSTPGPVTLALVLIGLILLGYTGRNYQLPIAATDIYTFAASLLIVAASSTDGAFRAALSGRIGAFLGWISFPLYLLHVPVLASFGSLILVKTGGSRPAAVTATVLASVLLSIPLAKFNDWWVARVNRGSAHVLQTSS